MGRGRQHKSIATVKKKDTHRPSEHKLQRQPAAIGTRSTQQHNKKLQEWRETSADERLNNIITRNVELPTMTMLHRSASFSSHCTHAPPDEHIPTIAGKDWAERHPASSVDGSQWFIGAPWLKDGVREDRCENSLNVLTFQLMMVLLSFAGVRSTAVGSNCLVHLTARFLDQLRRRRR